MRALDPADLPGVVDIRRRPDVRAYLGYGDLSESAMTERMATRIRDMANPAGPELVMVLAVELREEPGVVVGDCGARIKPTWTKAGTEPSRFRTATINYALSPDVAGRGLATEMVTALVAHLFAQPTVHRVMAKVFAENIASCRVLEKVGFTREGYFREDADFDGRLMDSCVYALLRRHLSVGG